MNRNVVLFLMAGLLGGMIARYTAPTVALAQNPPTVIKELRAQSFTLVDRLDHPVGNFSAERDHRNASTRIVLRDAGGRVIWSAGDTGIQPLTTHLYPK